HAHGLREGDLAGRPHVAVVERPARVAQPMADFYGVLGVARAVSDDEIKKAYRKLAMQYHPDRNNGSKDAEERFKAITEAYDVLRDSNKRAVYDRYGEAGLRGGGGFHHVDLSEALSIFMRDLGGLGGFGDLFGGG